jgi:2',3'-cyclic-nucleotide 2'-phosphodiesterase/3'-nucleotidase
MLTLVSCQNNEIDISIIYTTDVFGFIYPYDYQTDNNSRTSLAHFMTLVKEQRQIYGDDHCLVLDNGNKATGQSSSSITILLTPRTNQSATRQNE